MKIEDIVLLDLLFNGSERREIGYSEPRWERNRRYIKRSLSLLIIGSLIGYFIGGWLHSSGAFEVDGFSRMTVQLIYAPLLGYMLFSLYAGLDTLFFGKDIKMLVLIILIVTGLWIIAIGFAQVLGMLISIPKLIYKMSKANLRY